VKRFGDEGLEVHIYLLQLSPCPRFTFTSTRECTDQRGMSDKRAELVQLRRVSTCVIDENPYDNMGYK